VPNTYGAQSSPVLTHCGRAKQAARNRKAITEATWFYRDDMRLVRLNPSMNRDRNSRRD
jgi:hypothetical protein